MALIGEVGELGELFQWLTPAESQVVMTDPVRAEQVRHEIADVYAYLLRHGGCCLMLLPPRSWTRRTL